MATSTFTTLSSIRTTIASGCFRHLVTQLAKNGYKHPLSHVENGTWRAKSDDPEYLNALISIASHLGDWNPPSDFSGTRLDPVLLNGIGKRFNYIFRALEDVMSGNIRNIDWRQLFNEASLIIEPFIVKLFMLVSPKELLNLLEKKRNPGLATLIAELTRYGLSPLHAELLRLSDEDFKGISGWSERNTLSNIVRDIFSSRISSAHLAPDPSPTEAIQACYCAAVFQIAFVEHNLDAISNNLVSRSRLPLPTSKCVTNVPGMPRPDERLVNITHTRKAEIDGLRLLIERTSVQGTGALFEVCGPPGWGKSHFIAMATEQSATRVRYVDLQDCYDMHDVASTLLKGVPVSEREIDRIDKSPIYAVTVLAENSLDYSVLVLGNCHATDLRVQQQLPKLIKRLTDKCFLVITEGWSHIRGCIPHTVLQLNPLETKEVLSWAEVVLKRPADSVTEAPCLTSLEGYPALVASTLHSIRSSFPEGHASETAITDIVLESLEYLEFQEEWLAFATHGAQNAGPIGDLAPLPLLAAFAISPWGTLERHQLDSDTNLRLEKFIPLHLMKLVENGSKWERMPALWPLAHNALVLAQPISERTVQMASSLAQSTPLRLVNQSVRHCSSLYARGLLDKQSLDTILRSFALNNQPVIDIGDGYTSPTPAELQELEFLDLPMESRLAIIEGKIRRSEDANGVETQAMISKFINSIVDKDFASTLFVRDIHRLLLRSGDNRNRYANYCMFLNRFGEKRDLSIHALDWYARLLAYASETAAMQGEFDQAKEWRFASQHCLYILESNGSNGRSFRTIDTKYRLAFGVLFFSKDERELVQAHLSALAFIDAECPVMEYRWLRRWAYHYSAVRKLVGVSSELKAILCDRISAWPATSSFSDLLIQLLELASSDTASFSILQNALKKRLSKKAITEGSFEHRACLLITDPFHSVRRMALSMRIACTDAANSDPKGIDQEDLQLCAIMVAVSNLNPEVSNRHRADVFSVASSLSLFAFSYGQQNGLPILRWAIDALIRHSLDRIDAIKRKCSPDAQTIIARQQIMNVAERISHIMRQSSVSSPSVALPFLAERYISFMSSVLGCLDDPRSKKAYADKSAQDLIRFVANLGFSQEDEQFLLLTRHIIYRHLWMFEEAISSLERLLDCRSMVDGTVRFSDDLLIRLLPLFLDRPLLRSTYSCSPPLQVRARAVFFQILGSIIRPFKDQVFDQLLWVKNVIDNENDVSVWQELITYYHEKIKHPLKYWEEVQRILGEDSSIEVGSEQIEKQKSQDILEDLTNPQSLEIATLLATHGASCESLPMPLRRELADFAVFAAIGADNWIRSSRSGGRASSRWRVGASVVLALSLSEMDTSSISLSRLL